MEHIFKYFIKATNLQTNKEILIPRIPLFSKQQSYSSFVIRGLQLLIHLDYAMILNQAQGQAVQICGLLLEEVFSHMVTSVVVWRPQKCIYICFSG